MNQLSSYIIKIGQYHRLVSPFMKSSVRRVWRYQLGSQNL